MTLLKKQLAQFLYNVEDRRVVVIGMGNPLREDDAIGLKVIGHLEKKDMNKVYLLRTESTPENFTGPIRNFRPTHVLILDSTDFKEEPGATRIIPFNSIIEYKVSTHNPPMRLFVNFLRKTMNTNVALVGIQPKSVGFRAGLTPELEIAAKKIADVIYETLTECNE